METINNLANAASKAVWGSPESKEEPLSGAQGDPSKGEPFDKGNLEPSELDSDAKETNTDSSTPTTHKTGSAGPTTTKDSSVVQEDSTKAQNDVRSPSDPSTDPKHAEAARDVDDSGAGINAIKVDGPGPKPIDQVAREHGGDAGNVKKETSPSDASGKSPAAGAGAGAGASAGAGAAAGKPPSPLGEEEDGPQKVSHGEGTGEKYVKSSGLKADGGDFDAATAGAGKEADRLLEQKGIHPVTSGGSNKVEDSPKTEAAPPVVHNGAHKVDSSSSTEDHTTNGAHVGEKKEKRSLTERIKAKLHHHKDKDVTA